MAVKQRKESGKKVSRGLPLGMRLKAWWHGYDPNEIEKRIIANNRDISASKLNVATKEDIPATSSESLPALPIDPWDEDKIDISQYIWGKGFCGPGGPEYIISMSKLLALSPEMSMFQLGASLGGAARVLTDKFGVWMEGYEASEALVDAGNEMSARAGVSNKVSITHYDPEDFEGFVRKYDRGLVKEILFTVENKEDLIEEMADKLKPGGLLLITDYVLGHEAAVGKDRYKAWKAGEREHPFPILAEELVTLFKNSGLQVRVSEDISRHYIEMINKAWAGADSVAQKLASEENGHKLIKILMNEAEYWARRKKMLEMGDLKLWRIVANKKSTGTIMMSDW